MTYIKGVLAALLVAIILVSGVQAQSTIKFTPSTLTLYETEMKAVQVSGGSNYYIGTNGRPDIAGAELKDGILTVSAHLPGEGSISVCSFINSVLTCASLNISVLKKAQNQVAGAKISLSKSNVTVDIAQTVYLTVEGSRNGEYYVSANSNPETIYVGISGNIITVIGSKIGGSNITVCQFAGACGNFYAYVPPTAANTKAIDAQKPPTPVLSAFYVASNNGGGAFASKGAVLTFKFNTDIDVAKHTFKVGGQIVPMTGTSSGPYGGTYTVTGSENTPLPIAISFTTGKGMTGQANFTVGEKAHTSAVSPETNFGTFVSVLKNGSTGTEVTALQSFLKKTGVYAGPVTGTFGAQTEAALKKYQKAKGLDPVGYVGPSTRAQLNKDKI